MLTIESAKNPFYSNADSTLITLEVKFLEFDSAMSFGASAYDAMPYGVELYKRAQAGEFGEVSPFVASPERVQPTTQGAQTL